jgi:hypothetical protein
MLLNLTAKPNTDTDPDVIIKVEKYPEVDDDVILMKHIVNPEVIIKIDKEPEVEETKKPR